ncbi:unnamed protein product [Paramecium sonneborni]|uniref:Uncharacterized protein n=1 Tax=Paramecium sonneborni TaxID=65129 RepID=A0A8S1R0Q6_9CILI|nr:unnamed protein product [Paramecium sonneborni]
MEMKLMKTYALYYQLKYIAGFQFEMMQQIQLIQQSYLRLHKYSFFLEGQNVYGKMIFVFTYLICGNDKIFINKFNIVAFSEAQLQVDFDCFSVIQIYNYLWILIKKSNRNQSIRENIIIEQNNLLQHSFVY